MLSVALTPESARAHMGPDLSLAAINAPGLCVVSGPVASIAKMEEALRAGDVEHARIQHLPCAYLLIDHLMSGRQRVHRFSRAIKTADYGQFHQGTRAPCAIVRILRARSSF